MEIISGIGAAALGLLLVILIKLSTTLFHELGHAIPALLFTDKKVEVYIGSYGDLTNSVFVPIGRLKMYLKWNIFAWQLGLCRHEATVGSVWKKVVILLGGPVASLMISIPLMFMLKSLAADSLMLFICIVFIAAAIYDFVINMFPYSSPLDMHDGSDAYCDGYALYMLYKRQTVGPEYFELEALHEAREYQKVVKLGDKLLDTQSKKRYIYAFVIDALIQQKDVNEALNYYNMLSENLKLKLEDYFMIGNLYKRKGDYSEALKHYKHYWYENYENVPLLNEMGEAHIELGDNEEGLRTINTALSIQNLNLKSYLLRSKAYINLDKYEEARHDLDIAKEINEDEPMIYFNLGLLEEKLNRVHSALKNFNRAKELNCEQHGLEFKIESLKAERE